jgi:RsmE family RNA methyltransferase
LNTLLYNRDDILPTGQVRIADHRVDHLLQVLKIALHDTLKVGQLSGQLGSAKIAYIGDKEVILDVTLNQSPPPKLPVSLILALPRPKMLRRIFRSIAELGVAELHLINSYRVEKSYWKSPVLNSETTHNYFLQGLEQAQDTVPPNLHLHTRFKPFVEDVLPSIIGEQRALVAHPGDYPLCPRGVDEPLVLVIGPEGGFIPYEIDKLAQAGCEVVSLGKRILRVENAVSSILGRLF